MAAGYPKGERLKTAPLIKKYQLQKMPTDEYSKRTEKNIVDSDATLIFIPRQSDRGSALTQSLADKHGKPCIHIDLSKVDIRKAVLIINIWIQRYR